MTRRLKTAMILAAGRGDRMRPLTDAMPKPLLSVNGRPLIEYHLHNLQRAGFSKVVINHAWLGEQLVAQLGDGSRFGLQITYSREGQALETAGGIIKALPLLCEGDENTPFAVINGDIFTDYDFNHLPAELPSLMAHLVMVKNPEHHPQGDFALQDGHLILSSQHNKLTFSGIGVYSPQFFSGRSSGKQALAPLFREAIAQRQLGGEYYAGMWCDVGTPERLAQLNQQETN